MMLIDKLSTKLSFQIKIIEVFLSIIRYLRNYAFIFINFFKVKEKLEINYLKIKFRTLFDQMPKL